MGTRRLLFLTLLTFQIAKVCYSQIDKVAYVPPSPNASSLLEYASIPVNLNTGTAQVIVPLFELTGRKLMVPISLSYHASGIKVQDISSSVGLGWALNAGGVITRVVRGIADESTNGYFNTDFNAVMNDPMRFATTETTDTEPDIFFYNFNGTAGRLVFDLNKNIIQIPENNLQINKPDFASADPKWEIIDTDGVKYVFGKTSNARETTTSSLSYPINYKTYISSWHLSEIVYPFKTETISFTYQEGANIYFEQYRQSQEFGLSAVVQCQPPFGWNVIDGVRDVITKITINSPKYISTISSTLGSVTMSYSNDRQDISGALRLTQASLKNSNGLEVKKYDFVNSIYFVSDDCSTSDCMRLRLDKVIETTNGSNILYRTFYYNGVNLPSRKTVKYDHWGYYNNNTYATAIPVSKTYSSYGAPVTFGGANKSPDLQRTQANVLTKVVNAAGGSQELFFQLNEYDNGGIVNTGGLRVSKIIENDGTGINPAIENNFKYKKVSDLVDPTKSSGIIYRNSTYDYLFTNTQLCGGANGVTGTYSYAHVVVYSSSLIDLFDIGGMHINYSDVQIEYNNGSKEHLFFTNFLDHPDDPIQFLYSPDQDGPPFISKGDRSYERGLLTEHILFNSAGKKVKRIHNLYECYLASTLEAPGGKIMLMSVTGSTGFTARRGIYKHTHRGVRLQETTQETYDQLDETRFVSTRSVFTYSTKYSNFVKTQTDYLSDGNVLQTQLKYPGDYYTSLPVNNNPFWFVDYAYGIYDLGTRNIVTPVQTITRLKNNTTGNFEVISSDIGLYARDYKSSSLPVITNLVGIYKLKLTDPLASFTESSIEVTGTTGNENATFKFNNTNFKLTESFGPYDDFGNLLGQTLEDGENIQYVWGNNSSLISSVNMNAGVNQQLSSYVHKPLVGLESIKDPNSRVISYGYDLNNRLKLILNHDNSIMTRYRYHFKNESEFGVDFSVAGVPKAGNPITFSSIIDTEQFGPTSYIWDFGDGQVLENGPKSTSHSYSSSGTYTVKLSKVNSEYAPKTIAKPFTIYPNLTVSVPSSMTTNFCEPRDTQLLRVTTTGGCPGVTYEWSWSKSLNGTYTILSETSSWIHFDGDGGIGTFYVKCKVTSGCQETVTSNVCTYKFISSPSPCTRK